MVVQSQLKATTQGRHEVRGKLSERATRVASVLRTQPIGFDGGERRCPVEHTPRCGGGKQWLFGSTGTAVARTSTSTSTGTGTGCPLRYSASWFVRQDWSGRGTSDGEFDLRHFHTVGQAGTGRYNPTTASRNNLNLHLTRGRLGA